MKEKLHIVYELKFPCGNNYVGETTQLLNQRYYRHQSDSRLDKGGKLKCKLCLEYSFNEVSMLELERIIGTKRETEQIEQNWIDKLKPTLNIKRGYNSKEDLQQYRKDQYQLKYDQLKEERNTPEFKEKQREVNRLYYINNKEKIKKQTNDHYHQVVKIEKRNNKNK